MVRSSSSRAWLVVCAATGLNFLTGILYIWSVLSNALITELHWTSKEASLPYTVAIISIVIFMIFFGRIQDARGPRFTAIFCAIFTGSGLILSGLFLSPLQMVITFGIITGAGIGIGGISTIPPCVKWFPPERKGQITGIVVAGIGVSSVFFAPLATALLNSVGISMTFVYCGAGVLIAGLFFASQLRNPPEGYLAAGNNQKQQSAESGTFAKDMSSKEMLKTLDFYKLWLMMTFSSSAGLMIIGHTANIALVQVNWEGGFLLVVLLAIFNTLGRLIGGAVSDKIGRINTLRIIFSVQAINMLLFGWYDSISLLALGIALAGLNYGAIFAVYPAITVDFYGVKNVGANYGIVLTAYGAGGFIGPMVAAAVFDAVGSYNIAYLIACLLSVISVAVTLTFKSRQERENLSAA